MSKSGQASTSPIRTAERASTRGKFLWTFLCLALVLGGIFFRSFEPSLVLFANDAPYGLLRSQEANALSNFLGAWQDLNWLGSAHPSSMTDVTFGFYLLVGALGYAKFYVPFALLLLGLSAWFLLHRLGFHAVACVLGGLAAALSTDPFSYACWGLPPISVCMAAIFTALGIVAPGLRRQSWALLALAGLCVGFAVMEGYDTGAILSLYVAAFVLFQAWVEGGTGVQRLARGGARVAIVALLAAFMAAQALTTLIGTQVKGIVGTQQDQRTKEQRWNEATMWSLPKIETLRLIIPGLFGYRMDTPNGGNYWGAVGQTPGVPQTRYSGSGVYSGVLVVVLAAFALTQAARQKNSPFTDQEKKFVWFWAGAALVSLLLAYGRHAPFYQFFYKLPYFSTIRNPIKFTHPLTIAMVILFGYGVEALWRRYALKNVDRFSGAIEQLKKWWRTTSGFEKRWTLSSAVLLLGSGLGYLIYVASRSELEKYLHSIAHEEMGLSPGIVPAVARFSATEVGWFVLFLALALGTITLILSGVLSGRRARWAGALLGVILVIDFARANLPWVIYVNYPEKYATNPIIDLLRTKPHEHRVAARLAPTSGLYLVSNDAQPLFRGMIDSEWAQHHYPYYRIQALDIVQMSRMPELDSSYLQALTPKSGQQLFSVGRLWQLTNTRYILGMSSFLDAINQQIDPTNRSFRVHTAFDFQPRNPSGARGLEQITAVPKPDGNFALFEFGAALPRAKLFDRWEVITNETAALQRLVDPSFDPQQTVLVSEAIAPPPSASAQSAGSVTIAEYQPKRIVLKAEAPAPCLLLLNDKYDPNWQVLVNGRSQRLLRCNYIMRGVSLPAGSHTIEFHYSPPHPMLFVSLAALVLGLGLNCWIGFRPGEPQVGEEGSN